jgi:CO/xanthine dehydrogenase Mo-binding subunit
MPVAIIPDRQSHQLTSDAPVWIGAHNVAETKNTSKYVGHNYTTPDLVAKVTGKAKYAEDYRADGMLFAKLLLSPMPHARVTRIDAILDAPAHMQWAALDIADPETPVGSRGVGECPVGAGFSAVVNAISDAIGDEIFRRAPVTLDMILTALEAGRPTHEPLTANV